MSSWTVVVRCTELIQYSRRVCVCLAQVMQTCGGTTKKAKPVQKTVPLPRIDKECLDQRAGQAIVVVLLVRSPSLSLPCLAQHRQLQVAADNAGWANRGKVAGDEVAALVAVAFGTTKSSGGGSYSCGDVQDGPRNQLKLDWDDLQWPRPGKGSRIG